MFAARAMAAEERTWINIHLAASCGSHWQSASARNIISGRLPSRLKPP
jgi:hypothetical protein